jgi:hypothetical protein
LHSAVAADGFVRMMIAESLAKPLKAGTITILMESWV